MKMAGALGRSNRRLIATDTFQPMGPGLGQKPLGTVIPVSAATLIIPMLLEI